MPQRVTFDFSRPATLSHVLTGTAEFNGVTELGRAKATVGAADAATRVAAAQLGTFANGETFLVWSAGSGVERIERDGRQLRAGRRAAGTAVQLAAAINASADDPRVYRSVEYGDAITQALRGNHPSPAAKTLPRLDLGADNGSGTGGDPAATGLGTLAGGVDSALAGPNHHEYAAAAGNAGLFVFDHAEPLVLVQFAAYLSGSAAWALTLRPLNAARADLGTPVAVAGATAASALVLDKPLIIPPGWGLGLIAAAVQGRAYVTVRRAREPPLREPGLRITPERDVRESLIGDDQARLDTIQDLALRRMERRFAWAVFSVGVALATAVLALCLAARTRAPSPVTVTRAASAPVLTCAVVPPCPAFPAIPACPSLTCEKRRHRRDR